MGDFHHGNNVRIEVSNAVYEFLRQLSSKHRKRNFG